MDRNLHEETEIARVIEEAENCLSESERENTPIIRHKQKLKNELGFVAGQLCHEKAPEILNKSIDNCSTQLSLRLEGNAKPISNGLFGVVETAVAEEAMASKTLSRSKTLESNDNEKSWLYLQRARAQNGLSEYFHNTGNKKGSFKILLQAAKDYGFAGNDRQRAKCLVLAVENGVKFLLKNDHRKNKHGKTLIDMLDKAMDYYGQYDLKDVESIDDTSVSMVHQIQTLKGFIFEECIDMESYGKNDKSNLG